MKLFVDYRERHLERLLEDLCEEVYFTQLPICDYLIVSGIEGVAIERKTVNDFLSSIRSNRMWDQLLRMMKTEELLGYKLKRKLLLLHGNFEDYLLKVDLGNKEELLKHFSQLMGAFLEIIYVYNTPIIQAESDTSLKAFLRVLIRRECNGKNDKLPEARWYRKPIRADLPVKDRKKYILAAIPNIGNRLAENLLSEFNTISNVASASIAELRKVPKIGEKKADLIFRILH